MGLRRGLSLDPRPLRGDAATEAGAGAWSEPRRRHRGDRGRRTRGPHVPARDRPPQRGAHVRPPRRRPAQGSTEGVPPDAGGGRPPGRASPDPAPTRSVVTPRVTSPAPAPSPGAPPAPTGVTGTA